MSHLKSYVAIAALLTSFALLAQPPTGPAIRQGAPAAPARSRPTAFPTSRPASEPATIDRGKALYGVHCNFCHGSDARGGEGGPNLIRTELVLSDMKGELIYPVVRDGRGEMPRFNLTESQVGDIAAYIHNFPVAGYDASRMVPLTILVGDAKAGEAYFQKTCASCHSISGDLKGIASRITDAKQLQQNWLMPGGGRGGFGAAPVPSRVKPTTVTVTTPSGEKVEGRLARIDDFIVTLTDAEGGQRTFTREGNVPKVEIHEPLKPHKDLLRKYSDSDIHNVTSYLATVK